MNWIGQAWRFLVWRCKELDAWTALWVFFLGPFLAPAIVPTSIHGDLKVAGIQALFVVTAFGVFLAPVFTHYRLVKKADRSHAGGSQENRESGTHIDPRLVWEKPNFDRRAPWDK